MEILEVNDVLVSEAEKRLKKLERDYQHNYEKYKEIEANWYRFYIKAKRSNYRSDQAGYCIEYYHELQNRLKNDFEKLNRSDAEQRGIERSHVHCKEFSKLYGCKSLTKENKILQHIEETQQQQLENNDYVQENKHFRGNWELGYNQSKIPKSSSSKAIHKLLKHVKDPEKSTSQEGLTTRLEMEIKVLTKVINKITRERETRIDYEYEEKIEELKRKCEWICGKLDEEKKNILELKKTQYGF